MLKLYRLQFPVKEPGIPLHHAVVPVRSSPVLSVVLLMALAWG